MENGLQMSRIECPECGIGYRHALDCSHASSDGKPVQDAENQNGTSACEKHQVEFVKEGGMWVSKIKGQVVLTYKHEGACKRNTEKHLTRHNGYYAKLYV